MDYIGSSFQGNSIYCSEDKRREISFNLLEFFHYENETRLHKYISSREDNSFNDYVIPSLIIKGKKIIRKRTQHIPRANI